MRQYTLTREGREDSLRNGVVVGYQASLELPTLNLLVVPSGVISDVDVDGSIPVECDEGT